MKKRIGRGNGILSEEQKCFVVQRLACFDTLRETAEALNLNYGVSISPQGVERYNPTKRAGERLSSHLRDLFHETHKHSLEQLDDIPESHRAVRVRKLAKAARVYETAGDYRAMADMLERIAKEIGNAYTNRRELTGRAGGPMQLEVSQMSDEQLNARLEQLLGYAPWPAGSTTKQ